MPQILIGQIDVRQRSQSQPNSRKPGVEKTRKTQSYTDDSHTKGKQALRCQFPQLPAPMDEWMDGFINILYKRPCYHHASLVLKEIFLCYTPGSLGTSQLDVHVYPKSSNGLL